MAHPAEPIVETKGIKGRLVAAAGGVSLMVCAVGAVGALGFAATNSDAMISAGFDRAFARLSLPGETRMLVPLGQDKTEDEWLRVSALNPGVIKAAAVGQEIRLTGAGADHTLRIVDIADLGVASTHIDTSAKPAHVMLITCREGDDATGTEYRIRIEGGYIRDIAVAERTHAL